MTHSRFRLTDVPIPEPALKHLLHDIDAGAFACFEGWVRRRNDGRTVRSLYYQGYPALAEKEGERIIAEAIQQFELLDAICVHRVGQLQIGQMAVWVGVTAAHRNAAFDACRYIIDEVKQRVPIWKKEVYTDGETAWLEFAG